MARSASLPKKLLLLAGALLFGLGLAELLLRTFVGPPRQLGRLSYRDADGRPFADIADAIGRGMVVPLDPALTPRPRFRFAPGMRGKLCYSDQDRLHCDWLDADGCVEVRMNALGLRERDEIGAGNKQPGEQRIVCIGDSFTFGWGIPVERCWVRLLEHELRRGGADIRTVNCGAAGAIVADEYQWGLQHRFGALQPDCVIVTLCLNDLLPSNGLCVLGRVQQRPSGFLLFDYVRAALAGDPLALDPDIDWVSLLLHLPKEQSDAAGMTGHEAPYEAMWPQGTPQAALRSMRDWCRERGIRLLVVLWPFLQGLETGTAYPFAKMHELVAQFCRLESLPFLDLLPVLRNHRTRDLWVTPADMHANPTAHALVTPHLAAFVRAEAGL